MEQEEDLDKLSDASEDTNAVDKAVANTLVTSHQKKYQVVVVAPWILTVG